LKDVSADFPIGILTAIIEGGESGKVRLCMPLHAHEAVGYCEGSPKREHGRILTKGDASTERGTACGNK